MSMWVEMWGKCDVGEHVGENASVSVEQMWPRRTGGGLVEKPWTLGSDFRIYGSNRISYDYINEGLKFYMFTDDYVREVLNSMNMHSKLHCKN